MMGALPPNQYLPEFDELPEGHEIFTIVATYGDNEILHSSTIHLTPKEAAILVQTVNQLIVGIPDLREGEINAL